MPVEHALPEGIRLVQALDAGGDVRSIAWSPDGEWLLSGGSDLSLWQARPAAHGATYRVAHNALITSVAWCPDGKGFAFGASDGSVQVCQLLDGAKVDGAQAVVGVRSIAWSPDGATIAVGADDGTLLFFDTRKDGLPPQRVPGYGAGHGSAIGCLAWAPDGQMLASGTDGGTLGIWKHSQRSELRLSLMGHSDAVGDVAWSKEGNQIATASHDGTVRIWNPHTHEHQELSRMPLGFACVRFSPDGRLLCGKTVDGWVQFWRTSDWREVGRFRCPALRRLDALLFHPTEPIFATTGEKSDVIRFYEYDSDTLEYGSHPDRTASVVVVAEEGVSVDALVYALTNGRTADRLLRLRRGAYLLDSCTVANGADLIESRRVILWSGADDSAALLRSSALEAASVVLFVYGGNSSASAGGELRKWARAVDSAPVPPKKVGVVLCARIQHGRPLSFPDDLGEDLGWTVVDPSDPTDVSALRVEILEAIEWQKIVPVASSLMLSSICRYLDERYAQGTVVVAAPDLLSDFSVRDSRFGDLSSISSGFACALVTLQSCGWIARLRFGSYVLLAPELLSPYTETLMSAASQAIDGTGALEEDDIRAARFVPKERISEQIAESFFLQALTQELIERDVALRTTTNRATFIVFPSYCTRERNNASIDRASIVLEIEGPVGSAYAELTVRLAHSGVVELVGMWANVAEFRIGERHCCRIFPRRADFGRRELGLEFDPSMPIEVRDYFLQILRRLIERTGCVVSEAKAVIAASVAPRVVERAHVFISYSRENVEMRERLEVHLRPLERLGKIESWSDHRIHPGMRWRDEIKNALRFARIAVLLVSADFIASDFITEYELPELLKSAEAGGLEVLAVLLSPCILGRISQFELMNDDPLSSMTDVEREAVWHKVAMRIAEISEADSST